MSWQYTEDRGDPYWTISDEDDRFDFSGLSRKLIAPPVSQPASAATTEASTIYDITIGTSGDDTLIGAGEVNDEFYGLGGNDYIRGRGGNDLIYGGDGRDYLFGDSNHRLTGQYSFSEDEIHGGNGDDVIAGEGYDDLVFGDAGNDIVIAAYSAKNGGPAILTGADEMHGGEGFDLLSYQGSDYRIELRLWNRTVTGTDATGDTFDGFEGAVGSRAGDALIGNSVANAFHGLGGDDYIDGQAGDDVLYGGVGNDRMLGGEGFDVVEGGAGSDTLLGEEGFDLLSYAHSEYRVEVRLWNRTAVGTDANGDVFSGFEGVIGGSAEDALIGNSVVNVLDGGAGDDYIDGLGGNDVIEGFGGADWMDGGSGNDMVSYAGARDSLLIDLRTQTVSGSHGVGDTIMNFESARGGFADDIIHGNDTSNRLEGGQWRDYLYGYDGNDTLIGGAGNDVLSGGAGADAFYFFASDEGDFDRIANWQAGQDTIQFYGVDFTSSDVADYFFQEDGDVVFAYGDWQILIQGATVEGVKQGLEIIPAEWLTEPEEQPAIDWVNALADPTAYPETFLTDLWHDVIDWG